MILKISIPRSLGKNYTYCIVASENKVKEEDMKKLGEFKKAYTG
jgi:hypothetical protein